MVHQYQVIGRLKPTAKKTDPKVYRMKIFAPNPNMARSRFWYFMARLRRVKKANGQILAINEIFEKKPNTIKNFAVWIRYNSRSGTHNMCKEYRDTTLNGAIDQLYSEMAARHRARKSTIQIIKSAEIKAADCKRPSVRQYHDSKIRFPVPHRVLRIPTEDRETFLATRPSTFAH